MERLWILVLLLTVAIFTTKGYGYTTVKCNTLNTFDVPISSESDFGDGLNRDWMEGYSSKDKKYFRLYMATYDVDAKETYKDIWQDEQGNVIINAKGNVLWIGFGRPQRQIEFAEKYLKDGKKKHDHNKPLIRSILVDAETVAELSELAIPETFISRGMDINVDQSKSPNQFGLGLVSTELLRQRALRHSLVTYYLVDDKEKVFKWGLVKNVDELRKRIKICNMDRKILHKTGKFSKELLFDIKTDAISEVKGDICTFEEQSAIYRSYLVRRKVSFTIISEVMKFFEREGQGYTIEKVKFEKVVVKNKRITEKLKRGEDLKVDDLNAIDKSMLDTLNKLKPNPKKVDIRAWDRFSKSINQVKSFAKYKGTEVKLQNNVMNIWTNLFRDYHKVHVDNPANELPQFQLAQDTFNVAFRMSARDAVPFGEVCSFIKNNFIGQRIRDVELVSPLYEMNDIFIYAKSLSECLESQTNRYTGRIVEATRIVVYSSKLQIYRFYPDSQVGWSEFESGTVLLFHNGNCIVRIKGRDRHVDTILKKADLLKNDPNLLRQIENMQNNHGNGIIIVPQKFITWPKKMDETLLFEPGHLD